MWILDIIELLIEECNPFAPKHGVWFWLAVALIICVIIGLVIYFVH